MTITAPAALRPATELLAELTADADERINPPTVCLCGSTRFWAQLAEANLRFTAAGCLVLAPGVDMKRPHPLWSDPADAARLKHRLDRLHRHKIDRADHVVIVTDPAGYVGASTLAEIVYAHDLGTPTWHWALP